jgi:hypothetical protein
MAKGPSAWITHLKSWTATKSKSNPNYTYRDAMKDPAARAEYKKHHGTASSSSSSSKSHKKGKKMRGGSGYGGEASLANAASIDESSKTLSVGGDVAAPAQEAATPAQEAATPATQSGGKKSRRRKGTKGKKSKKSKKSRKTKSKSRSSRK